KKTVPTAFEFTDIAGIVEGASKGEGLGNQFLSHIRQVDAICHVVRCFQDDNITHVSGKIDPIDDIEIINLELILSDLETVNRRYERTEKLARQKEKEAVAEFEVMAKLKEGLEAEKPARALEFTDEQMKYVNQLSLLTSKSILYAANVSEDEIADPDANENVKKVKAYAAEENAEVIVVCAKIEAEIAELDQEEKEMFLEELGIPESGLDQLIKATYDLLGFATYFTAGEQEEIADPDANENVKKVKAYAAEENAEVIVVCAKIEAEIAELDQEEKEMFLEELGIPESGLDQLIKATYDLLGFATYFTAGEQEVRAW